MISLIPGVWSGTKNRLGDQDAGRHHETPACVPSSAPVLGGC